MADLEFVEWPGVSGKYGYYVYDIDREFEDEPGNYIFAKKTTVWAAVYIGETSSLEDRLPNHEKKACAKQNGAAYVHVHASSGEEVTRKLEEQDLIKNLNPVCNG